MRSIRLIPCLDVKGGRVVKGVRFVDLTDEGDPVELAARYDAEGADEVTFLDITEGPSVLREVLLAEPRARHRCDVGGIDLGVFCEQFAGLHRIGVGPRRGLAHARAETGDHIGMIFRPLRRREPGPE